MRLHIQKKWWKKKNGQTEKKMKWIQKRDKKKKINKQAKEQLNANEDW